MKLENYGLRGNALVLIKNYSTKKTPYVWVNNQLSTKDKLLTGVPQGTILEPLYYILMILRVLSKPGMKPKLTRIYS